MYDIIIKNGNIYDGLNQNGTQLDLAIKDSKIVNISPKIDEPAKTTLDAQNLVVAPGFIDSHSHNDFTVIFNSSNFQKLEQGVTSEVVGLCGETFFPVNADNYENTNQNMNSSLEENDKVDPREFSSSKKWFDYLSKLEIGTNMISLVGHGAIRANVMGFKDQVASKVEIEKMKDLLTEALQSGARGFSSGLAYAPGLFSDYNEILELCKVLAKYNGVYSTHMRNQGAKLLDSIAETIELARITGCTVVISHLKSIGKPNFGKVQAASEMIIKAQEEGLKVYCDAYPYLASSTTLKITLPPSLLAGGDEVLLERLATQKWQEYVKNQILEPTEQWENSIGNNGFESILIIKADNSPNAIGKNIAEYAKLTNQDVFSAYFNLILENKANVSTINFVMAEEDLMSAITLKYCMIGTDGSTITDNNKKIHPRNVGTFPQFFTDFVRERKILSLKEAIYKTSYLPSMVYGLKNKGQIQEGFDADLTIFDPHKIKATSNFQNGHGKNEGIQNVICNGVISVQENKFTGKTGGGLVLF